MAGTNFSTTELSMETIPSNSFSFHLMRLVGEDVWGRNSNHIDRSSRLKVARRGVQRSHSDFQIKTTKKVSTVCGWTTNRLRSTPCVFCFLGGVGQSVVEWRGSRQSLLGGLISFRLHLAECWGRLQSDRVGVGVTTSSRLKYPKPNCHSCISGVD